MKKYAEIFDVECFINYFLVVFYRFSEDKYFSYEISEWTNEIKELRDHCKEVSWYIGFNNQRYDCPILEAALSGKSNLDIYHLSNNIIELDRRVYTKLPYIDLQLVNHYGIRGPKTTSLKKLAFFFRKQNVYDSPENFTKPLLQSKRRSIATYCKNDVLDTFELYNKSKGKLSMRKDIGKFFITDVINSPDPSMGESIFCKTLDVDPKVLLSNYVEYPEIHLGSLIYDFIGSGKTVDIGKNFFKSITLKPTAKGYKGYSEDKKSSKYKFTYSNDINIVWGLGGIHGAIPRETLESNDEYVIKTFDVASQYPSIILNNNLFPVLLGDKFIRIYKWIYDERFKYEKGTTMNAGLKLLLNSVFGKLNNEYSIFRDPKMFFTITVNNQLAINWLCDLLCDIPGSRLLTCNTDGSELMIPRKYEDEYFRICSQWESDTKFKLEHDNYRKLYIHNINNYIGQFESGKIKRKGLFCTYEDLVNSGDYHKDSSNNIVPLALTEYFINNKSPEDFIRTHTNLYDFLLGASKTKAVKKGNFEFLLSKSTNNIISHNKITSRLLRYYASNEGYTACKLYEDSSIISLHADTPITVLDKIKNKLTVDQMDINYDWYINEVNKIINDL